MSRELFGNPRPPADPRRYARTEAPIWAYARTAVEWLILPLTLGAVSFAIWACSAWSARGLG